MVIRHENPSGDLEFAGRSHDTFYIFWSLISWAGDLDFEISSFMERQFVRLAIIWLVVTSTFDHITSVPNQRLCMQSSHSNSLNQCEQSMQ